MKPPGEYRFTISESGALFDTGDDGLTSPVRAVASEVAVVDFRHSVGARRAERALLSMKPDGLSVVRVGRRVEIEGPTAGSASSLLAKLLDEGAHASGRVYGYLSFLLAILTVGTWLLPCTLVSVLVSGAVFLALVAVAAGVARSVAGVPFYRSVGGLILSFTSFFVLFAFLYVIAWLHDAQALAGVGRDPPLGEMFLVSLGVAVSGGTIAASVHEDARIIAYVEMLLVFGGGATLVAAAIGRYLVTEPDERREGPAEVDEGDGPEPDHCPTCGRRHP